MPSDTTTPSPPELSFGDAVSRLGAWVRREPASAILFALAALALLLFAKAPTWAIALGGALLYALVPGI